MSLLMFYKSIICTMLAPYFSQNEYEFTLKFSDGNLERTIEELDVFTIFEICKISQNCEKTLPIDKMTSSEFILIEKIVTRTIIGSDIKYDFNLRYLIDKIAFLLPKNVYIVPMWEHLIHTLINVSPVLFVQQLNLCKAIPNCFYGVFDSRFYYAALTVLLDKMLIAYSLEILDRELIIYVKIPDASNEKILIDKSKINFEKISEFRIKFYDYFFHRCYIERIYEEILLEILREDFYKVEINLTIVTEMNNSRIVKILNRIKRIHMFGITLTENLLEVYNMMQNNIQSLQAVETLKIRNCYDFTVLKTFLYFNQNIHKLILTNISQLSDPNDALCSITLPIQCETISLIHSVVQKPLLIWLNNQGKLKYIRFFECKIKNDGRIWLDKNSHILNKIDFLYLNCLTTQKIKKTILAFNFCAASNLKSIKLQKIPKMLEIQQFCENEYIKNSLEELRIANLIITESLMAGIFSMKKIKFLELSSIKIENENKLNISGNACKTLNVLQLSIKKTRIATYLKVTGIELCTNLYELSIDTYINLAYPTYIQSNMLHNNKNLFLEVIGTEQEHVEILRHIYTIELLSLKMLHKTSHSIAEKIFNFSSLQNSVKTLKMQKTGDSNITPNIANNISKFSKLESLRLYAVGHTTQQSIHIIFANPRFKQNLRILNIDISCRYTNLLYYISLFPNLTYLVINVHNLDNFSSNIIQVITNNRFCSLKSLKLYFKCFKPKIIEVLMILKNIRSLKFVVLSFISSIEPNILEIMYENKLLTWKQYQLVIINQGKLINIC